MSTMIQGFYDCSGQWSDGRVTLAGYAAPRETWEKFDECWSAVLRAASCPYLHMIEGRGPRDAFAGWTTQEVESLIRDLLNRCLIPHGAGEDGLFGAYCTIERQGYERACRELPELAKKDYTVICAEYVTSVALWLLPQDPAKPEGHRLGEVELTFDRGEPFHAAIEAARNRAKSRRPGRRGPLSRVSKIESADKKQVPGLQAADYLAWHVNRWRTRGEIGANLRAVLPTPGRGDLLDYEQLMAWYRDGLDPLRLHP